MTGSVLRCMQAGFVNSVRQGLAVRRARALAVANMSKIT
jgi:hypothetical protein